MVNRAIDCLIYGDLGDPEPRDWTVRVEEGIPKGGESFFESPQLNEQLDEMDANGSEHAIATSKLGLADHRPGRYAERAPERLSVVIGGLDLLRPMSRLRALESIVEDHPNVRAFFFDRKDP